MKKFAFVSLVLMVLSSSLFAQRNDSFTIEREGVSLVISKREL